MSERVELFGNVDAPAVTRDAVRIRADTRDFGAMLIELERDFGGVLAFPHGPIGGADDGDVTAFWLALMCLRQVAGFEVNHVSETWRQRRGGSCVGRRL